MLSYTPCRIRKLSILLFTLTLIAVLSTPTEKAALAGPKTSDVEKFMGIPKPNCRTAITESIKNLSLKPLMNLSKEKQAYEAAVDAKLQLFQTRKELESQVVGQWNWLNDNREAREAARDILNKHLPSLREAPSVGEAKKIADKIDMEASAIVKAIRWKNEIPSYQIKLDTLWKSYARREGSARLEILTAEYDARLANTSNRAEAEALIANYQKKAQAEVEHASALRKKAEYRYHLNQPGNSHEIVDTFKTVLASTPEGAQKLRHPILNQDLPKLLQEMERAPELKRFVYRELQVFRKLEKNAAQTTPSRAKAELLQGLDLRLQHDLDYLQAAVQKQDATSVQKLMGLRTQIRRVSDPKNFAGILGKNSALTQRLSLAQRERLLMDAMKSDEVAAAIVESSVPTPVLIPPKPPVRPDFTPKIKPQPTRPDIPSKSRLQNDRDLALRTKKKIDDYKSAFARWKRESELEVARVKKAFQKYQADHASYRIQHEQYQKRAKEARDLMQRRAFARQGLLTHIGNRPQLNNLTPEARQALQQRMRISEQRIAQLSAEQRRRVEEEIARRRQDNNNSDDFLWFLYTGNPMWLINRDLARVETIFDFGHFGRAHVHDLEAGLDSQHLIDSGRAQQLLDEASRNGSPDFDAIHRAAQLEMHHVPEVPNVPDTSIQGLSDVLPEIQIDNSTLSLDQSVPLPSVEIPNFDAPNLDAGILDMPAVDAQIPNLESLNVEMPVFEDLKVEMPSFDPPSFDPPSFGSDSPSVSIDP
jgi:hypothetical protein